MSPSIYLVSLPILFAATTALLVTMFTWPLRWLLAGAPLLQFTILVGSARGTRILPFINLYPMFTTLNLLYAIASTSWLLYNIYAILCYPAILLTCLFQFSFAADIARRTLRALLKQLHFIDDKIAFFNIPALEIDTDVSGLMVLRGVTFSLSTLSFVVHGVEVGIKLSDDMELAIQTEHVEVKLFRGVWVGDCFANLKGGKFEMTFGDLEGKTEDADGNQVFVEDTPLLKAALKSSQESLLLEKEGVSINTVVEMKDHLTNGQTPGDTTPKEGLQDMKTMSSDNELASGRYRETLEQIKKTCAVEEARQHVKGFTDPEVHEDRNVLRAAICSELHSKPSVPHPPQHSVKVTTLQNMSPLYIKRFQHRLPMLLRLLLNPLSYFHPVTIESVTATASGRWIESLLVKQIFEGYWDSTSEISSLKQRISAWLSDANFAVELGSILSYAHVPFFPIFNIKCDLAFDDVMAYRALPKEVHPQQVIRLGGADASFLVPSFLLPHHEHLLPPPPTKADEEEAESDVQHADGKPNKVQAEQGLKNVQKDETNVKISAHARLPAVLSQDLLDFVAALLKASKIVEIEKKDSPMDADITGVREFASALGGSMRGGFKKAAVDGVMNDRIVAKLVGKVIKKLEGAVGDVGYSGNIPVPLGKYRGRVEGGWSVVEGEKILP